MMKIREHRMATTVRTLLPFFLALPVWTAFTPPTRAHADTFSIAAVDVETGEIGSAGASCVGPIAGKGAFILSDILPGIGVIHTQASYLAANQQTARERMLAGDRPHEVLEHVVANDAQGNAAPRQYGIVDLRLDGESAAYTGDGTIDYKGHITGTGYAIQGNILMGPEILERMQKGFTQSGSQPDMELADRLMASLLAAQIVGADTRCARRGTSSQSAFLKVVHPDDEDEAYLELVIPDSEIGQDPIGLLHAEYLLWKTETGPPSPTPITTATPEASPTPKATPTAMPIYLPRLQNGPAEAGIAIGRRLVQ